MAKSLKNMMGGGLGAQSASLINGVVVDGLTATGTTQIDALPLTSDVNVVGTVPSGSGVMLPAIPQPSDECVIANLGSNTLNVYPASGGTIQGGSVNAAYQLSIGAAASFIARTGSQNWAVLSSGGVVIGGGGGLSPTYTTWFGNTDATTGWITLPLGASNRRIWQGPGGSDAADGLSYANRKLTLDAAVGAYMTGHTPGDQLMIAGGQTLIDNGNHGRGFGDLLPGTALNPNAAISYNAAAPTDSTQYGRLVGAAKPWISQNYVPNTQIPYFSMDGGTGSGYTVFQGIDFDGNDLDGNNLPFVGVHNYICFQNCRFKGMRLAATGPQTVPGTGTYSTNWLISKCSGWGQWANNGNSSWLYIEGIDNYVEENVVGGHCGWRMSATRGGSVSTGSPNIFAHGRYFSPFNSNSAAVNGRSRRAVWFDNAADGDNDRAGMFREQTVVLNDPLAGQNGGFSAGPADNPNGCLITARDGLVMGGNDIDDGTSLARGGAYGNNNTLSGSGMDNYAFLGNPKFQTPSTTDILIAPQGWAASVPSTFAMSRIRAYKAYSHLVVLGGDTPSRATVTWNDVITDPEGGVASGTACSTWSAPPPAYQTPDQLAASMGFSVVTAAYNAMLTWPHLPWAQAWLTLGLPSMGLVPSWASVSPPDISALGAPLAIYPTTAPTVSLPTGTSTGTTTATVGATTDRATGKLYYVVTTSSTQPTKAQIRAGQNAAGSAAVASGSQIVTSTGVQTENATGLTASTAYFVHLMHEDQYPVSLQSNISTSASFTTSSGAFSPSSLSPSIWIEADPTKLYTDAGTTLVSADGQAVQQANDKSTNARNVSQATSTKRPLYKTTTGKPSLLFDGVDDVLASAGFTPADANGQHWVALSLTFPTNTGTQVPVSIDDGSGSLILSRIDNNTGSVEATSWNAAQSPTNSPTSTYTANTAVVLIYTVTTTAIEMFVNNVSGGTTALTGTRATGSTIKAFLAAYIGVSNFTNMHLYGFVSAPGTLSSTDRGNLNPYMAALHP